MSKIIAQLTVVLAVLLAFIWGYKKDAIYESVLRWRQGEPSKVQAMDQGNLPPSAEAHSLPAGTSPQPVVAPAFLPPAPNQPARNQAPPAPHLNPAMAIPNNNPLPANPYKALQEQMKTAPPANDNRGEMYRAFENMQRDSVDTNKVIQDNPYFRTLSEQLKQLGAEQQNIGAAPAVPPAPGAGVVDVQPPAPPLPAARAPRPGFNAPGAEEEEDDEIDDEIEDADVEENLDEEGE